MKAIRTWKYLTLMAVVGFWGCSSSNQIAQNTQSTRYSDDLYGSSADAPYSEVARNSDRSFNGRTAERLNRRSGNRNQLNANPDYAEFDSDTTLAPNLAYNDEYYSDLSARKVTQRGISADPGWSDGYNNGFSNGYNTALANNYGWNTWGWNNIGMFGGLGLGFGSPYLGLGFGNYGFGYNSFYSPFYSPFNSLYGYGYSPFYSGFGYGYPYGGYYGGLASLYGYGYGGYGYGGYGLPVAINNPSYDLGAGRARTVGARSSYSSNRYNGNFVNTARGYNNTSGARVAGGLNASNNSYYSGNRPNDGAYYSNTGSRAPRNNGGNYYYNNNSNSVNNGRGLNNNSVLPRANNNSAASSNSYYSSPRRSMPSGYSDNSGSRYNSLQQSRSYQQSQPTYNQPSFQNQSRSFSQPSFNGGGSRGFSGGGGGFSGGGGHSMGGGGGRGPR